MFLALVIGLAAGAVSGYYGGKLDGLLMRITDVFLAFPYILAAIVLITVIGRSLLTVIIVLGVLGRMPFARLFRSSILQIKELEYIEAARAAGCGDLRIILRHILPNAIQPIIVYADDLRRYRCALGGGSLVPRGGRNRTDARVGLDGRGGQELSVHRSRVSCSSQASPSSSR